MLPIKASLGMRHDYLNYYSDYNKHIGFLHAGQCDNVIHEEPNPVLEPLGTEVELQCRVDMAFRTAWIIVLPIDGMASSEILSNIAFLTSSHGIVTEVSSTENREPPLRINGTIGNSGTTVQCNAIELANPLTGSRCPGTVVPVTFHGK